MNDNNNFGVTKRIDSRDNRLVKLVCSLADKKYRDREKLFCFEGAHLLEDYLAAGLMPEHVFFTEQAASKYQTLLRDSGNAAVIVGDAVYGKMTLEKSPQGIMTVSKRLQNIDFGYSDMSGGCIIALSVRDAGNLGTVLRTANAFGIRRVICSNDCADVYGPKTVRAAMGAIFRQRITVSDDITREITSRTQNGINVYAAVLNKNALLLSDGVLSADDCVIIGNEGQGIPDSIASLATRSLIIPMQKGCESLNASAAATVLMWEMRRAMR